MLDKIFVLGTAGIFFVYGLLFIAMPLETFQLVADGTISSYAGITDVRATYGGMSLAVGLILVMLGRNQDTVKQGLVAVFVLMVAMAMGRSVGIALDGNTNTTMYVYLALELVASLVALVLLKARSL